MTLDFKRLTGILILLGLLALLGHLVNRSAETVSAGRTSHRILSDSLRVRREAVLERIRLSDTYIAAFLPQQDSILIRWHDRTARPVRVFISKGGASKYSVEAVEAVRRAFERWSSIRGIPVEFQFLFRPQGADVHVLWRDSLGSHFENAGGIADRAFNRDGWIQHATITIPLRREPGSPAFPVRFIYQIALHEIGHVLGLGHSDRPTDIMAPSTGPPELTERDVRSAQLLYQLQPGSVRLSELR